MAGLGYKIGEPAEKSPTVHYANWKEDMLLLKRLHVLNRSERNVVHRIKIDQKVLFKRFQGKLHRSQLTKARLMGDKDLERELRASKFHGLNVDIVNTEKDFEFLDQLKMRSKSTKNSSRQNSVSPKSAISKKSAEKEMDTIIQNVFKVQSISNTPRVRSKSFSEGVTRDATITKSGQNNRKSPLPTFSLRPATSGGERYDGVEVVLPDIFLKSIKGKQKKSKTKQSNKTNNQLQVNFENDRAKTCSPHLLGNGGSIISKSPSLSRRQSVATSQDKGSRRASMFSKEEKVDVVQLLLDRIKTEDYSSKVKEFCDSLDDQCVDGGEQADYYNLRMKGTKKESKLYKPLSVPGTPEVEYKRHVGNVNVLSLTVKPLNFDFSRRDHSYSQSAAPDLPAVSYFSSDDDDSDIDDEY
ncbi:hypothetical protein KP79_PYT13184 [Mizuhopecten yessoensis]|uniref:Uncharacterized protein n=1 Tax=Mizuhopecten yessoensis TaxID=6573 RepID=A0A210Q6D8_MIZYE|nr:hypothetical protein KP79_PYT13184 [Mizuhopecten yessoensis]